ncbi:MAG: peptidoglycan bridge formation glycyltransferase FemA/FemB family protein [Methanosarcinaceae archaeon]|nr:peptidoglycan bridge formation glycyltransferase FemA/FemB family protein [Methanosarcinaceae archaeon]
MPGTLTVTSRKHEVEVDTANEHSWNEIIEKFIDVNIYQTWAWGAVKSGKGHTSHILLRRDTQIVAVAQTRIFKIPNLNAGIAYVRWGPLWRRPNIENDIEDLYQIITAMRREYVDRRGLFLRIIPYELDSEQSNLRELYEKAGLRGRKNTERTLYISLREPLETIKGNISRNWRKKLHKAEKNNLNVVYGTSNDLFDIVDQLCQELHSRKTWLTTIPVGEYRNMQRILPDNQKLAIFVCQSEKKPIAILVGSALGDIGMELIAATGNAGLELRGSYLLRWKMIEYLKENDCNFYNLNGINLKRNPGGYQFKSGLCGKNGLAVEYLGIYEACTNPLSYIIAKIGDIAIALDSSSLANRLFEVLRKQYKIGT